MTTPTRAPADYPAFFASLRERIELARVRIIRLAGSETVLLYWDIGQAIAEKQAMAGWGDAVVERLSRDLVRAFPGVVGFSVQNLWRMRQFYLAHSSPEFLSQAVRELGIEVDDEKLSQAVRELLARVPWGHHANALARVTDPAAKIYYLRATAQLGWTRNVLLNQIKAQAYERAVKEKKTHNFATALPEHFAEQADEMIKSRYDFGFLGIGRAIRERELEDRLIDGLQAFILELGYGFCFIGRQYRLSTGRKEYFIDLLFYHRFLKALVAFELKIGPFEPEHAGQMDFYLNLLNEKEKAPGDAPSIGIILCAEKDDIDVEFALKSKSNPIGVAAYQLQPTLPAELKGRLPTAQQLADAVREHLPTRKSPGS
ncbi:PDDEXK nuclease domain-containing protein [Aquisphaera insulae]|uniref:PDDEXK nuclease domain-containing protein n=1 Tax=Aquisphaera insulae TaxID=2712864 RepID=UPI0013ED96C6|nr:PDDEXK nuclease domain-containing protein [Aquisphaera insulae]